MANAKTVWRDFVTDGIPSSGIHDPVKSEIRVWGTLLEQQANMSNSPLTFGATGDGITNDSVPYAATEAANENLFLPPGTVFNLGSAVPVKPVYGPGKTKVSGVTLGGVMPFADIVQGNVWFAPDSYAEKVLGATSSPGGQNYFNTIIGSGSGLGAALDKAVTRSTILGSAIGESIVEWERVEAIGNGAMRFSELAERTTAIGSLVYQWLGARSRQHVIDTYHDWWLASNNGPPGSVGWDFLGMETRGPGIGAAIQAFTAYPTTIDDAAYNVGLGRDAGLHLVKGFNNVLLGYRAGTNLFSASGNTAVGTNALRDAVFGINNTAIGNEAGMYNQQGVDNLYAGTTAGKDFASGDRNTIVGVQTGRNITSGSRNVFLGYGAGFGLGASTSDALSIRNATATKSLIGGDFAQGFVGVNAHKADLSAVWQVFDIAGKERFRTGEGTGISRFILDDDGAGAGPIVILDRKSASPAANDVLGTLRYYGRDSVGAETNYADIFGTLLDPVDGTEDASLTFRTMVGGSLAAGVVIDSAGVRVPRPLSVAPGSSVTPANNGDVTFQLTSNTSLTFKAKGSDGTVRSGSITLA